MLDILLQSLRSFRRRIRIWTYIMSVRIFTQVWLKATTALERDIALGLYDRGSGRILFHDKIKLWHGGGEVDMTWVMMLRALRHDLMSQYGRGHVHHHQGRCSLQLQPTALPRPHIRGETSFQLWTLSISSFCLSPPSKERDYYTPRPWKKFLIFLARSNISHSQLDKGDKTTNNFHVNWSLSCYQSIYFNNLNVNDRTIFRYLWLVCQLTGAGSSLTFLQETSKFVPPK